MSCCLSDFGGSVVETSHTKQKKGHHPACPPLAGAKQGEVEASINI